MGNIMNNGNSFESGEEPQIYVADLAEYNAGRLIGKWIDLEECNWDSEVVLGIIHDEILAPRGHEEWAVHDYNSIPICFGECPNLEAVCKYAELLSEHGEAFATWFDQCYSGGDFSDFDRWDDWFQEAYQGDYGSMEDYAEELMAEGCFGDVPDNIKCYIDYSAVARDLKYDGYVIEDGHVFRSC